MNSIYVGVDIGSATVKVLGISFSGEKAGKPVCVRHDQFASQVEALKYAFKSYLDSCESYRVRGIGITGSGRELNRHIIGGDITSTEIFAHSIGTQYLLNKGLLKKIQDGNEIVLNKVGTIIEIGGQDSKVIVFDDNNIPCYFNMNTICSAGTGEFLKQIADEAGISLEEFSSKSMEANRSARIDSTCTVFSRRDFRHLTQKGVSLAERLRGVCDAMVKNYIQNVVKGYELPSPIIFQGGVAFNEGVKKAFERILNKNIIVPPDNELLGALGMAVIVMENKKNNYDETTSFKADFIDKTYSSQIRYCHGCQNACELSQPYEITNDGTKILDTIGGKCEGCLLEKNVHKKPQLSQNIKIKVYKGNYQANSDNSKIPIEKKRLSNEKYFAGIDGGSRGTKFALVKSNGEDIEIVSVGTLETSGDAIKAIKQALFYLRENLPPYLELSGIGTTGSAGELARDIITTKARNTSDIKSTEIIAHITWAKHMVPNVRTIIDIGGNDTKIISINDQGVDFAMNDKCAAGAGAFIEAISKRFEVPLENFGDIALKSKSPARIAGRCAVFGESDIIHKSRAGFPIEDLFMGLAYSICRTYLSDIGKGKALSVPIVAQGGAFINKAIKHAFMETLNLTKEEFIIAKDEKHVIGAGALGVALLSKEAYEKGYDTGFKGFDYIINSDYYTKTVTCSNPICDRRCEGLITLMENKIPIAGYKSINCQFGHFEGMLEKEKSKNYIQDLLEKGLA
ncbi:MAG: acyl-CoA dehydratase activase [Vulcanibacillus sp.]